MAFNAMTVLKSEPGELRAWHGHETQLHDHAGRIRIAANFDRLPIFEADEIRSFAVNRSICRGDRRGTWRQLQRTAVGADKFKFGSQLIFSDHPVFDGDLDVGEGREPTLKILTDGILAMEWLWAADVAPRNVIWEDGQGSFHIVSVPGRNFFFIEF